MSEKLTGVKARGEQDKTAVSVKDDHQEGDDQASSVQGKAQAALLKLVEFASQARTGAASEDGRVRVGGVGGSEHNWGSLLKLGLGLVCLLVLQLRGLSRVVGLLKSRLLNLRRVDRLLVLNAGLSRGHVLIHGGASLLKLLLVLLLLRLDELGIRVMWHGCWRIKNGLLWWGRHDVDMKKRLKGEDEVF